MFSDITEENAKTAIKVLIKEGELNKTQYGIWWKKQLVSPAKIISKHYELQGKTIDRKSFNTNQAQSRLLELGFPVVESNIDQNFFSEKELQSFEILIARKNYDSTNEIDINIGNFLKEVIWNKTKLWAEKVEKRGWKIISKRRGWNTRHQKKGFQTYKQYAWCSLKPEKGGKDLLLFTVGVGTTGNLEYKMDIQFNDKSFTKEQKDLFENLRSGSNAGFQIIKKENISRYTWESLIKETNTFFSKHLPTYTTISNALWPEKRVMRLVYNTNNWQVPVERYWNKSWQGRKDKPHHDQYGFGFEEWLFNSRYLIGKLQYGYVRGVDSMPLESSFINELYLYTLNDKTHEQFLVAKLINVTIYRNEESIDKDIIKIFENAKEPMVEELKIVNADFTFLRKNIFLPNISFVLDDAIIYDELVPLPDDFLKIHRFIPNKIEKSIEDILSGIDHLSKNPTLDFREGNGTGANAYTRQVTTSKKNVNRTHSDITNLLHQFLDDSKDFTGYKISTEKTKVGNNLVDCAAKKQNNYIFFEVKTTNSFLTNVRMALGQIIEYALLDKSINIEELVIVSPAKPNKNDLTYFQALKDSINLPLNYWSFSFKHKSFTKH